MIMAKQLSKQVKFAVAIGVQLLSVIGIVVFNASLLMRGTEVLLPIEPYDPRDPLRGDYMTIQYDISRIEMPTAQINANNFKEEGVVYVTLKKDGGHWIMDSIEKTKPDSGLFIKGNIKRVYSSYYGSEKNMGEVRIEYGIENYFIPEGTGSQLARKLNDGTAYARVVVSKDGASVLKGITFSGD